MTEASDPVRAVGNNGHRTAAGVVAAALIAVVLLLWAKWLPYSAKVHLLASGHGWPGSDILRVGGVRPGDPPSWSAAVTFTRAYARAVWPALVAALLIAAALQSLVPRAWLVRLLNRRGKLRSAAAGGLAGMPSMMCTCCTAPVAVELRRSGVSTAAAVGYWLGNPLLNPAVLIFLLLVAPWQWTVTRAVTGLLVVVGGASLAARFAGPRPVSRPPASAEPYPAPSVRRFLMTLLRLSGILVPEYVAVVALIGAFRGWLLPVGGGAAALVVLVAVLAGTALVIPTGGEIPVAQGLALAGLSLGGVGALLITLPAVSLPSMVMVGRALGWRTVLVATGAVAAGGVFAAGLLLLLTG